MNTSHSKLLVRSFNKIRFDEYLNDNGYELMLYKYIEYNDSDHYPVDDSY